MAQPTVLAGTKLLLLVGNGASPEVFAEPCGLTTKSFDFNASTNTNLIPDCDDPEAPAWETTDINALSASLSGSGLMTVASYQVWREWFLSAEGRNMHVKFDHADLGHYTGSFKLLNLKHTGSRGNKVTVEVSAKADGAVAWVDAT
jgi:predicted secreted protein